MSDQLLPSPTSPPLPPLTLRPLVGPVADALFDNPTGDLVFPDLPVEAYDAILDWGCGCGRLARQLIQQHTQPRRYVGLDLHRGMVRWCQNNLTPCAPQFRFEHLDVHNPGLNPTGAGEFVPFPVDDHQFSLLLAWSVFTHVTEPHIRSYLEEVARVLRSDGVARTTWFLFDKRDFPMMQEFQNGLYLNLDDPTNATIFDRAWLVDLLGAVGLKITRAQAPVHRGFQWLLDLRPLAAAEPAVPLPEDTAAAGVNRPPLMPQDAAALE